MKRQLSYQFDLDIERVYLLINMKCDVQVWWKSGKGKIATKNSIKLAGTQKYFDVRQKLSIIAKIVMQNGILRQKKTQLLIILFTSQNTSKLGGRVYLNLAQFISPDSLTATVNRRFEKSLENCPDEASKIVFNLNCKYIQQNFNTGSQNIHDISFQASTFSNTFGGNSNFGKNTSDMTFRPDKQQNSSYRRTSGNVGLQQGGIQSGRPEFSSKQKKNNDRDWEKQKMETPSWDRSYRDRQQYDTNSTNISNKNRQKQFEKPPPPPNQPRPLQFSFNPTQADRQKIGIDNAELIRDLKQNLQERGKTIRSLQQQLARTKKQYQQRTQKSSSKTLSILNEVNAANVQKQQLQRQKLQLVNQLQQIKQQNKKLQQKCKAIQFQYSQTNNQYLNKLQQRKKMIEDLNNKLEQSDRKAARYQDQLFRKQNQIITKQKQFITNQINKQSINKEQTQKLKNISLALKDLQNNFQKLFSQKQELRKKYEENIFKLQKLDDNNQKVIQNYQKLQQQLIKQKQKCRLLQARYKQRQTIIQQIQNQFKMFSQDKAQQMKQKEDQISQIRDKFNAACKKIDQISNGEESMKNTISEKNIKIKSLEGICQQLQKTLQEKQELILKAKQYVIAKEQQIEQKNAQIIKRDQFIQKCRTYMQNKQKQYNEAMEGIKTNNSSEGLLIKKQLKQKQKMLEDYINQRHRSQKQFQDMSKLIQKLKIRIMQCQDEMDQLHRKNESQQFTLKDLVKKNLDMQIQINIKDYQIHSLRSSK